jgi:hypothetical protein
MKDLKKIGIYESDPTWVAKLTTGEWTAGTDITLTYQDGDTHPGHVVWVSKDGTCALVRNNDGDPPVCICDTVKHRMCRPAIQVHTDDGWNLDDGMQYGMEDPEWVRLADAGRLIIDGLSA